LRNSTAPPPSGRGDGEQVARATLKEGGAVVPPGGEPGDKRGRGQGYRESGGGDTPAIDAERAWVEVDVWKYGEKLKAHNFYARVDTDLNKQLQESEVDLMRRSRTPRCGSRPSVRRLRGAPAVTTTGTS
jgi:hypothetical protein